MESTRQFISILQSTRDPSFANWAKVDYANAKQWCETCDRELHKFSNQEKLILEQSLSHQYWIDDIGVPNELLLQYFISKNLLFTFRVMLTSPFLSSEIFSFILKDFYTLKLNGNIDETDMEQIIKQRTKKQCISYSLAAINDILFNKIQNYNEKQHNSSQNILYTKYYNSNKCIQTRANAKLLISVWEKNLETESDTIKFYNKLDISIEKNYVEIMVRITVNYCF